MNLSNETNRQEASRIQLDEILQIKNLEDGKIVKIQFNELKDVKILGHSQFVVKEMIHEPTNLRFAVKVKEL